MEVAINRSEAEIESILRELTLEEKAALCSGNDYWSLKAVPRLGILAISVADGPHGLRKQRNAKSGFATAGNVPSTCYPSACALASTWNLDLLAEIGGAIGDEAAENGVSILLGPGVNIKRSPLGGRNFEYYSEDPYLSGHLASSFIAGVQSKGIGASIKHFAANNQEARRFSIDSVVDPRALREIYLRPFEIAIRGARPWTVMAAYNRLNGEYCTESGWLLTDILRGEWGFDGLVLSDWGAVDDRPAGISAGMDLEMPGFRGDGEASIVRAVQEGKLSPEALDDSVRRVLNLIFKASAESCSKPFMDDVARHELAMRAAVESAVLLKNDGGILPIGRSESVAIVGSFAREPKYQGAGSSKVTPKRLDSAYGAIMAMVESGHSVTYASGYDPKTGTTDRTLILEAKKAAEIADKVIVFAGLPANYETEGLDRPDLCIPEGHVALIEAVSEVNPNVAVVLMNGAPVEMPWASRVKGILEAYLGGQAGGTAVARLLLGLDCPSGKLAETFPLSLGDNSSSRYFPGGPSTAEYRESIYVGYRYYDKACKDVLFPFGHGLSYARFSYGPASLSSERISEDGSLEVSVPVTNEGEMPGKEVVQLYVRDIESSVFRPDKELKGFVKLHLDPHETRVAEFRLDSSAFSFWDVGKGRWAVESGAFEILIGSSSRDIRSRAEVFVTSAEATAPCDKAALLPYFEPDRFGGFDEAAFGALYGKDLPENLPVRRGNYSFNTPLGDMVGIPASILRGAIGLLSGILAKLQPNDPEAVGVSRMLRNMPLRMLALALRTSTRSPIMGWLLRKLNGLR